MNFFRQISFHFFQLMDALFPESQTFGENIFWAYVYFTIIGLVLMMLIYMGIEKTPDYNHHSRETDYDVDHNGRTTSQNAVIGLCLAVGTAFLFALIQ